MIGRGLLWFGLVLGCSRIPAAPAVAVRATPVETARARVVANRAQARFSLGVHLGAKDYPSTGGALILDRPGRGHLAVLGPLGGPLAVVQTDGAGLGVAMGRDRRHYVATAADEVIGVTTNGALGIDDVLGLFVGDLPLDAAPVSGEEVLDDGTARFVLTGPDGMALSAVVDPQTGAPMRIVATDATGVPLLEAVYGPFVPLDDGSAVLVPSSLDLALPGFAVRAELTFKAWTVPDPMPEVFGLRPPEGFSSEPLENLVGPLLLPALASGLLDGGE